MPAGQSQLYNTTQSIEEADDSSSMHTGLGTRYNWKSILPDDVYSEVNQLFKDNKSPADFMLHTGFSGIREYGTNPYSYLYNSTPRDMDYGDMLSGSNDWEFGSQQGNQWDTYQPEFNDTMINNSNSNNLLHRLNDLGPNAFPEGSSLEDVQSWMGSFISGNSGESTFPMDETYSELSSANWGNWSGVPQTEFPNAYHNDRRINPYYSQYTGSSGNTNRKAHRELAGVIDDNMADTFQGGQTTSQNLLGMTDLFNPSSIGDALTEAGDLGETSYGYAPPLSMDMIREARSQHYRPLLEASRGSAYSDYNQAQSEARSLGSGFAGYGGRARAMDRATDAYSKQVGGTMSEMSKLRGDARGKIGNVINEWRQISNT